MKKLKVTNRSLRTEIHRVLTGSLRTLNNIFDDCDTKTVTLAISAVDLNYLDTSSVTDMSDIFSNVDINYLDISSWNTSSVTNMSNMFYQSTIHNVDLSKLDVSNVRKFNYMFNKSNLVSDISNWKLHPHSCVYESLTNSLMLKETISELHFIDRANNIYNFLDYQNEKFTPAEIRFSLKNVNRQRTLTDENEIIFMKYAEQALLIHEAFGSSLFGQELGRYSWELYIKDKDSISTPSYQLPSDFLME